jgi:hypothetical protein
MHRSYLGYARVGEVVLVDEGGFAGMFVQVMSRGHGGDNWVRPVDSPDEPVLMSADVRVCLFN